MKTKYLAKINYEHLYVYYSYIFYNFTCMNLNTYSCMQTKLMHNQTKLYTYYNAKTLWLHILTSLVTVYAPS